MKIHEYQAKQLFKRGRGSRSPKRRVVATTPDAVAVAAYQELDRRTCAVVKAQIHAGGRGKGGGVKLVQARSRRGPIEAAKARSSACQLVTHQTGPEGQLVKHGAGWRRARTSSPRVLPGHHPRPREQGKPVHHGEHRGWHGHRGGGRQDAEKILKEHCSLRRPACSRWQATRLAYRLGLSLQGRSIERRLPRSSRARQCLFLAKLDASLAEINPLVLTGDGRV